jgi:aminopeptidase N
VKLFPAFLVCAILIFSVSAVFADSAEEAAAFFEKIGQKDLIIDDLSRISPEERKEMLDISHDFCRMGKAQRLQRFRDMVDQGLLKKATVSQFDWDALYYEINFDINFNTEIITGYVQTYGASLVPGLTFIELDFLDNMSVDSVKMDGANVSYTHANDLITITLDYARDSSVIFSAYVYYHGHPTEGGFQAFEFGTHNGTNVATTLSEPYFGRSWWPSKDTPNDKADSVDIIITHPDNFVCASNGLVQSIVDNGNGTKTTHWFHGYPIATYLVAIGVTDYSQFREWYVAESGDSMPVDFFVYPEKLSQSLSSYPITADMVDTMSGIFGEYPFVEEKYGMLHFDWGGAMEHQTNTSMSSTAYYESIIVHELGHQWWGDMITCENWHEIWMNEGFATYTEALWFEATQGEAFFKSYMNEMFYSSGGTIWCQDTTSVWSIFSSRVYDKGAWVLHMLRHFVGDSLFFEILHTYYDDPRYKWGTINTEQFRDLCIEVTGDTRLNDFFQDWIWGEYYPSYRYSYTYEEYQPGDYVVYVHIRQMQGTDPQVFHMPIDLAFHDGAQHHTRVVYNDRREQDFILYLDDLPYYPYIMYLDKDYWIMKTAVGENYGLHAIYDPLDTAIQYSAYSDSVIVKGGTKPYNISIISGSLPNGLSLNPVTGQISGVPTGAGLFEFEIKAEDNGSPTLSDTETYMLFIEAGQIMVGDANFDAAVNVSDAVYIINYVFVGGPEPAPILLAGDANCDETVNVSDSVWIINYVFLGGPAPGDC